MSVLGKPKHAQAVTPSDSLGLRFPSTYLSWQNGTGSVTTGTVYIDTVGGETNVPIVLPQGMYPICATKVYATNTTAQNIVAYWDD